MAIARQTFIRNLHQVGVLTVAALGIAVAGILWVLLRAVSGFSTSPATTSVPSPTRARRYSGRRAMQRSRCPSDSRALSKRPPT